MKNGKTQWIGFVLLLVDLAITGGVLLLSRVLIRALCKIDADDSLYLYAFEVLTLFFFAMYDLYKTNLETVYNTSISVAISEIAICFCGFLVGVIFHQNLYTLGAWLIVFALLEFFMVVWRTVVAILIKRFSPKRTCLIIENMNNTSRLARKIKYAFNEGRQAFYIMLDEDNEQEVNALLDHKIAEYDMIFIAPSISQKLVTRIMGKAYILQKDVSVLADLDKVSTLHGSIYQLEDTPVIEKKGLRMSRSQRIVKRAFDIVFSLTLSILTLPISLLCALAVKLDSPGPALYKQERYTIGKKVFPVYKFRTMVQDAEKNGAQFATEKDPRITKVGAFLRATRLDELPQLYNILLGSMSVVGPRPERPVFADEFSKNVGNYDMRYCVKAGLTGYAQVYGKYNTRVSDKILMDLIYVVDYSFLLDIKLILLTIKTMFVKSATEGVDEQRDEELRSEDNEKKRREETLRQIGAENEDQHYRTGV